jgi:hypothetical protein
MGTPVNQGSAAPTPFGATLSDSVGGSLLEFLQLRSTIAVLQSVPAFLPSRVSVGPRSTV